MSFFDDARVNTYVRVDDDDILLHAAVYMLRVATMLLCVRIYERICAARVHDDDNTWDVLILATSAEP